MVRPTRLDLEKSTAYECGFFYDDQARSPFSIGFYLTAILFLIFDIEVRFLLPWRVGGVSTGLRGFWRFLLFLGILTLGFVYEWAKGRLDWQSLKKRCVFLNTGDIFFFFFISFLFERTEKI